MGALHRSATVAALSMMSKTPLCGSPRRSARGRVDPADQRAGKAVFGEILPLDVSRRSLQERCAIPWSIKIMAAARSKAFFRPSSFPSSAIFRPTSGASSPTASGSQPGCGLAVFGTNSEANSMSAKERMGLLDAIVRPACRPTALMPAPAPARSTRRPRSAPMPPRLGVSAWLMLPPFYYKAFRRGAVPLLLGSGAAGRR